MIRVAVELVPEGDQLRTKTLGVMLISNEHVNRDGTADYSVRLGCEPWGDVKVPWRKRDQVARHDPQQNVWKLVRAALGEVNP